MQVLYSTLLLNLIQCIFQCPKQIGVIFIKVYKQMLYITLALYKKRLYAIIV